MSQFTGFWRRRSRILFSKIKHYNSNMRAKYIKLLRFRSRRSKTYVKSSFKFNTAERIFILASLVSKVIEF